MRRLLVVAAFVVAPFTIATACGSSDDGSGASDDDSGADGARGSSGDGSGGGSDATVAPDGSLADGGGGDTGNAQPTPSGPITAISVKVSDASVGAIAPGFLGISLGKESEMTSLFTQQSTVNLFANLADAGVLRIGGTDVDFAPWADGGLGDGGDWSMGKGHVARVDLERLAAFLAASGWSLLYGVDLLTQTPDQAAEEVATASSLLVDAGATLYGVEIGNEPDLYYKTKVLEAGLTYEVDAPTPITLESQFFSGWQAAVVAIRKRVPDAPLTGPALGSGDPSHEKDWMKPFVDSTIDAGLSLELVTQHYYSFSFSGGFRLVDGGFVFETPDELFAADESDAATFAAEFADAGLDSGGYTDLPANAELVHMYAPGLPLRIDETNSLTGDGLPPGTFLPVGLADGQGSALWIVDHLFDMALDSSGSVGANVISGPGTLPGSYSTFTFKDGYAWVTAVRPEYYGMLLFAMAGQGPLLATQAVAVDAGSVNVSAYTVQQASGEYDIVINNKEATQAVSFAVDVSDVLGSVSSAQLYVLTASDAPDGASPLYSTVGQTLQGSSVVVDPDGGDGGGFVPNAPYDLAWSGTTVSGFVPRASAALLKVR